jgi:thiamine biosynthesis lipoprotein
MAVVTSGDYENYSIIDGVRYAHIIDPRTGYPCRGLKSVTIICPDAEIADALATGIFVMGQEKGLELINQLDGVECVLVNDRNEIIESNHVSLNYVR